LLQSEPWIFDVAENLCRDCCIDGRKLGKAFGCAPVEIQEAPSTGGMLKGTPERSKVGVCQLHTQSMIEEPGREASYASTDIQNSARAWNPRSPMVKIEIALEPFVCEVRGVGIEEVQPLRMVLPGSDHANEVVKRWRAHRFSLVKKRQTVIGWWHGKSLARDLFEQFAGIGRLTWKLDLGVCGEFSV
jgi:hypothetical protein